VALLLSQLPILSRVLALFLLSEEGSIPARRIVKQAGELSYIVVLVAGKQCYPIEDPSPSTGRTREFVKRLSWNLSPVILVAWVLNSWLNPAHYVPRLRLGRAGISGRAFISKGFLLALLG
jgi:hypothetical protein